MVNTIRRRNEAVAGYLFIMPQLIGMVMFSLLPIISAIVLTFFSWDLFGVPKFVGLANYIDQFKSEDLRKAIFNTVYYTILVVPVQLILALLLALSVNKVRGKVFYRVVYFSPVVTNSVAVCMTWLWLYNGKFGAINGVLSCLGINGPDWLVDTRLVMPAIAIVSIWQSVGYYMVLFLSGLQSIPRVYYEAAIVDGTSPFKQFLHITLPLLSSTSFFVLIMSLIGSFQVFEQTFIMTGGGPAKASYTLVLHIYENAFKYYKMGTASTSAIILFIIILIITSIQLVFQKKWVYYED